MIDGPSSAIARPAGLGVSVARDGTGGLVYLKSAGGTTHVFISRLAGGQFQAPVQIDPQLSGASSQPVIAAGSDGLLLAGFINAGQLYVVEGNGAGQFTVPNALAGGAMNPALSMTSFGKAYLAFVVADGGAHDVRTAYYNAGSWSLEGPPLNALGADDAGVGGGRPVVAAAGDGIAIVAWGEQGHIYSRRVWGTTPSVVAEQADGAPAGCTEGSVDHPVIAAGGDSSFAPVAFHATLFCGGKQDSRVLMNRLHGSVYDGVLEADGLAQSSSDSADYPQIELGEYGAGWVTSRTLSGNVLAGSLLANSAFSGTVTRVNSVPSTQPPYSIPSTSGLNANLIAWEQKPGSSPGGDIRVRFAGNGSMLGPETVVSSPAGGPTDAADGLGAAGDITGDVALAWLQGGPGATEIVVNQLYQPPGGFSSSNPLEYTSGPQPVLAWNRPNGWGPMRYSVILDGNQIGQTYSTSFPLPGPLPDGPHSWQVIATNPAGQQSGTALSVLFVDTVAPRATLRRLTRGVAPSKLRVAVRYADHPPPGEPAYDASGVARVVIRWGDGTLTRVPVGAHFISHRYRRSGRYKIRVFVSDRAGNLTRLVKFVKVSAPGLRH